MRWPKNCIYALVDPRDGKINYVGKSSTGKKRPISHTDPSRLMTRTRKNNWIRKLLRLGLKPRLEVLWAWSDSEPLPSVDAINETERYYIKHARLRGYDILNGTDGGDGGDTGGGRARRRKVIAVNLTTHETRVYDYVTATAADGFSPSKVTAVCRGHRVSHQGHLFRYLIGQCPPKVNRRVRRVKVHHHGESAREFGSVREAANFIGADASLVSRVINGHIKSVNGYRVESLSNWRHK